MPYYDQSPASIRFEWGLEGVRKLGPGCDVLVIVDVLSFTTSVGLVVEKGGVGLPYGERDDNLDQLANEHDALIASSRKDTSPDVPYSLSPASLLDMPEGTHLVMPSANGSALSKEAANLGVTVLAGSLRNAAAVATACKRFGERITVVAAGERWEGYHGQLRPALEDLIGAGAILSHFERDNLSSEARAAVDSFKSVRYNLLEVLQDCSSGRELIEIGYDRDVEIAAHLNVSKSVPILGNGMYVSLAE